MATDFELLDAWRAGDAEAGNRLFARHFDAVCRFFRNKAGDATEDLIQRTFLNTVRSRDAFAKQGSFRAYLFTIARNELYHHLQRQNRERARIDPKERSIANLDPSPTSLVAHRAEQRILLEALRRIPVNLQIALELFYWEDMSASELGVVLDLPEGTVRSRLRKARQLLHEELGKSGANPQDIESTRTGLETWARSLRALVEAPLGDDPSKT